MKKLLIGIALAILMTASSQLQHKVYLPLVIRGYERKEVYCNVSLYDSWGISPGYVTARAIIEYDDQVRIVKYPNGELAFRWETHLIRPNLNPGFDINFLWQNPNPDSQWHNSILVGSAWEAVTHLGGSKGYTIYANIEHNRITCTKYEH